MKKVLFLMALVAMLDSCKNDSKQQCQSADLIEQYRDTVVTKDGGHCIKYGLYGKSSMLLTVHNADSSMSISPCMLLTEKYIKTEPEKDTVRLCCYIIGAGSGSVLIHKSISLGKIGYAYAPDCSTRFRHFLDTHEEKRKKFEEMFIVYDNNRELKIEPKINFKYLER